jgi:hypothetical protein
LKTIIDLSDFAIHHIPDKYLIPVFDHPARMERKILDRQKDFDAVAYCLAPQYGWDDIQKNEFGKPMLHGQILGISHSHEQVVVAWGDANFGLDIQRTDDKIHRLASKFINDEEAVFANDIETLTIIWSAKEAVFKFFGHSVDFAKEMFVSPFKITDDSFVLEYRGIQHKIQYFRISFIPIQDAYLTLAQPL